MKDVMPKAYAFRNQLSGGWSRAPDRVECRSQVIEMKPQTVASHWGFVLEIVRRAAPF